MVVDCSFGSGRSLDWASITKAELMAENRSAYKDQLANWQEQGVGDTQKSAWC